MSVSLIKLTKTDDGTEYTAESDFQSYFSALPANGALFEISGALEDNWDTGDYTLEYSIGLAAETEAERN